ILSYRYIILKITIPAALLVFLFLFFISPNTYKAPVTLLPPSENDQMTGLGNLLGGGDFTNLLLGGGAQGNSQLYMEIIKSRTAAEYVVNKYNLVEYFDAEDVYDASEQLKNKLVLNLSKEGIVTVSVEVKTSFIPMIFADIDSAKSFAAALSNSYIEALDKINREKISYKAKRARQYIEEQLGLTKASLDSAEFKLMNFQRDNKTISLPDQLRSAIESSAEIKAEIIKTEIEIGLLKPNLREDNKVLLTLRSKLAELQKEYDKFEIGTEDYLVAFNDVPELGMQLAQLLREVKIQSEVYLLLQQQYYKEKIQENRDLPTIEILDEAIPPLKASGPRVILSTLLSGIFIFLLVSLYFVVREKNIISLKGNKN
ncbi:MAG: hypothetical protein KJO12_02220, partial [Ignavibacteria bacterium]|nr:hypothetical protein [Ignavibacteria bacterium]